MRRLRACKFVCWSYLLLRTACLLAQPVTMMPVRLTTDSQAGPVGVGAEPHFGWNLERTSLVARGLRQKSYRIQLSTSGAKLVRHSDDLWDSGQVTSSTYWQRPYQGPALQSHKIYYWRVQVWSEGSLRPGPWSRISQFTTALLSENDWTARWIAAEPDQRRPKQAVEYEGDLQKAKPPPLPVFRYEFSLKKKVSRGLLYIAGLGQYEVHLNGKNVTETVLNPPWTDYRKTLAYNTFNVSKLLRPDANAIGVLLGNGMYNVQGVKGHYTKFVGSFGQPKCLVQLEVLYEDGSSDRIASDRTWKTHPGPVLYSSTFGGEEFDAGILPHGWDSVGFPSDGWRDAMEVVGPGGALGVAQSSPMVIAQTYPPVRITNPKLGVTVYDMGQNLSGWPSITVLGPAGSKVTLLPGELLGPDKTVTQKSANATFEDPVLFTYILRGGKPETWHPRFAYYGFRYVQVTTESASRGSADQPKILLMNADFVHARAPIAGTFQSSNKLFKRIHVLIDRAVMSNLASVVTDCPSREKLGWLEQTYLNASTLMLNYDVTGLYEKMSDDMRDAQLPDGLVPSIAPEYVAFVDRTGKSTSFRDSPEWGSAVILSPWALYQYTGNLRPLEKNYKSMQRYAAYLKVRANAALLNYGLGDWYDIGPKAPGPSQLTSRMVTATGVYYEDLVVMGRIARLLHTGDAASYEQEAALVRDAFNAALFHPETDEYDFGSQTANAIPLALGIVPSKHVDAVLKNLVADIHAHDDHVTAGDIGFHYVVRALTESGRSDVVAAMLSRTDSPSYGYQLARGATTLTEAWDSNPEGSQNHFMLGHGEEWFYRGLAGLSVDMTRGNDALQFRPSFLKGIEHASASNRGPMGVARVAWKRSGRGAEVDIAVPAGAEAHLILPVANDWREGAATAAQTIGVVDSGLTPEELCLTLGSGDYHFSTAIFRGKRTGTDR